MNIDAIRQHVRNPNVILENLHDHSKASEKYISVIFRYPEESFEWKGWIPYHYRRAGLEINDEEELARLIETIYPSCSGQVSKKWVQSENALWEIEFSGREVTKSFFELLLNLDWTCVRHQLPANPNPQRRIQDIKEAGYLLATDTKRYCNICKRITTQHLLLPVEKNAITGYETFSPTLKRRIIHLLNGVNVYEARVTPPNTLIPDHKFPEIRWDALTKVENPDNMSDQEIRNKFQLLDNQRNQQKREACRTCFQTNKRGKVFGINYYYEGDENWNVEAKIGKDAEKGCVGCGWYDLQKWRESLNRKLEQ